MPAPWERNWSQPASPQVGVTPIPPSPQQIRDNTIKEAQLRLQQEAEARQRQQGGVDAALKQQQIDELTRRAGQGGLTADKAAEVRTDAGGLANLRRALDAQETEYKANFQGDKSWPLLGGMMPDRFSEKNQNYNKMGLQMRPFVTKALAMSAKQMDTPAELRNIDAYIPSSSDFDKTAESKFGRVREMLGNAEAINRQILPGQQQSEGAMPHANLNPQQAHDMIARTEAEFKRRIADKPPAQQAAGWSALQKDPEMQALRKIVAGSQRGRSSLANAPRKSAPVIDFNDWGR